ncbi:MAG TPA: aldehyde dehydrogenase family protein [Chitinophagales bacterium]|nr:aldehyde dehydrogenase family protein [Chitinophagales bacterium]
MRAYQMYIGGKFTDAKSGKTKTVINPATGESFATVPDSQEEDVNAAAKAARSAFDSGQWRKVTAQQRGKLLFKLSQLIFENADRIVHLEVENNGKPKREAEFDVSDTANCFEFYAGLCTKLHGETMQVPANSFSYVLREPLGVCGQIIPWNYPFLMSAWKMAPALAAGNCVILKPSELTPVTALELAKLIDQAGFPAGVVNIISGDGPVAGNAMTHHPLIDKIAFTGGTVTGKKIMEAASKSLKKLTLELGGKNPAIFFEDCDLDLAADWGAFASFANQGQVCSAGSRLLIQETIYDELVSRLVEKAKKIKLGNGMDEGVTMGPLISEAHRTKVENYIKIAKDEGAKLLLGGDRPSDSSLQKGWFLNPTIFSDVQSSMRNAKEEIFGPVMSIIKFKTEEEAIAIANDTEYGLAGGIFTQEVTRAHRVTSQLRCGILWVNYYHPTFNEMPWGGYKQSGSGRELGLYGIEAYLETKQVNINLDTKPEIWYS